MYCKKIAEKCKISVGQLNKLIPMLKSKEKYVLHYRSLQLYVDLGLNLTKVQRVLEFDQSLGLSSILTSTLRNEACKKSI